MIESGRRIGIAASTEMSRSSPGSARPAHFGASTRIDVLVAVEGFLVEDARVFEEDGAAILSTHSLVTRSITVCSTAMRTATPLRT